MSNTLILLNILNTGVQAYTEWLKFQQNSLEVIARAQAEGREITDHELQDALTRQNEAFERAQDVYNRM